MQLQLHIPVKILSLKTEWRLNDEKCHFLRLFFYVHAAGQGPRSCHADA